MKKKTAQRETQEQKLRRIVTECIDDMRTGSEISHCNFTGVHFDAKAVDAITTIAEGLRINALALGDLAKVLNASNVTIETMVKITGNQS